ncbi:MAG: ATP-dependent Clp protease ATP-binding subunit [Opitutaceae bacterium]|nr:ATP-dependent Clp protease ATP-binding subunit [Cephaloticoccus sp.]MCP5530482.1 ATP-dependent Clp protease ATP-binding subunit [Opitutaceae bacterium]
MEAGRLERLRSLESHLQKHLLGQDQVLRRAAAIFARGELGLTRNNGPRGTFLAVGPTGTGKTELVLLAADYLFGPGRVRRFDLSEFQREDAVERLLGADSSEGGAFGRMAVGDGPCVWLFDELEKAHPKVFDLFIQILEPGRLTLANGQELLFDNHYVVFTSNIGAPEAMRMAHSNPISIERAVLRRVGEVLRPELLARIPEQLAFNRLDSSVQRAIAELHLNREVSRLGAAGHALTIGEGVMEFLLRRGFHPQLGARPLRQTIERCLQDAVVRRLLSHGIGSGHITADISNMRLDLS